MEKRIIKVVTERAGNNFSAFLPDVDGIAVTGKSIDEIRASMQEAVRDYLDTCREMGKEIPEEFSGEYELQFDLKS